jgi:hypothetical protein
MDNIKLSEKEEDEWISVEDRMPTKYNLYPCKDATGHEFKAFAARNGGGKVVFLPPSPSLIVTHWKPLQ